ncbi:PucR family transcriptional regulator [Mycolicibacterium komossense]|uniref:Helix-turn-helix domain-containing protein n=1 Tax=Mycolicibacterium komossense TaxID=1779 RepID=A0ABT3CLE6_9MYCO|nr:helix-turn-helix domain-containing protein [Mycolicibacterium komossense]MCV7230310.1 helix-turn-helix domain-containing protein [Mycolicibacterium komossense]
MSDKHSAELAAIVAALAPTGPDPGTGSATAARLRAEELLGPDVVAWAAQVAGEVAAGTQARPLGHAAPTGDIAVQAEILILGILFTLTNAEDAGGAAELATRTESSIRQLIATGVPFERVAETIRFANELAIRALLSVAIAHQASAATLTTITLTVTTSADAMLDTMATQYLTERQRFSSSGVHAQQELIERLIAGSPVDPRLTKSVLNISVADYHLGFVVSGTDSSPLSLPVLRRSVQIINDQLRVSTVVVREHPDSLWMWATFPRPARLDTMQLAAELDPAVRVGVGTAQSGASGFRRTHLEALAANQFGRTRASHVIDYHRHGLPILLSSDTEKADWFVTSELGELATPNPRNRDLVLTLRCYFDSKLRIAVAAERLHVHRNTAISRLATLETILGHPVTERMAEVQAALAILDFGHLDDDQS